VKIIPERNPKPPKRLLKFPHFKMKLLCGLWLVTLEEKDDFTTAAMREALAAAVHGPFCRKTNSRI